MAEYTRVSGGRAVEELARAGDPLAFPSIDIRRNVPDCSFSFTGIQAYFLEIIRKEEIRQGANNEFSTKFYYFNDT